MKKELPKRISVDEHVKLNPKSIYRDNRSRLFTAIFREKEDMLSLYNAINGTSYDNPDDVIVTELEDAIYLGLKGDLSFIVDFRLNIHESDECIDENVLREYLLKHRNETYEMSIFECTDEEIINAIKESEY